MRLSGLYAITPEDADTARLIRKVAACLEGGASAVQYRNKQAPADLAHIQALQLHRLCQRFKVPLIINDFRAAFHNHCDVIATPVSPTTAFRIGEKTNSPLEMYLADVFTVPINLAGLPALSVPSGLDGQNLPIGLQLIGAPFTEKLLLKTAYQFEQVVQFDCRPARS